MNNTFKEIWDEISKQSRITICTHINPDGDTIAGSLLLKELILLNTNIDEVKISGDKYPRYLSFLPKNDVVDDEYFDNSLKIVVDTSTKKRIFDKRVITKEAIKIDHHHHEGEWLLEYGGDHWPAVGEVLWNMIDELNLKINSKIEELAFVSIWTDTEGMTQRQITKRTHDIIDNLKVDKESIIKKMSLNEEELKLINTAEMKVIGDVTYSYTEQTIPNDIYRQYVTAIYNKTNTEVLLVGTKQADRFRFGLRSKGNLDISKYAVLMGGGGHFASAGFNIGLTKNKNEIIEKLIKEINNDWKKSNN